MVSPEHGFRIVPGHFLLTEQMAVKDGRAGRGQDCMATPAEPSPHHPPQQSLPDFSNKNIRCPVKTELQINSKLFFSVNIYHAMFKTNLYKRKKLLLVYQISEIQF